MNNLDEMIAEAGSFKLPDEVATLDLNGKSVSVYEGFYIGSVDNAKLSKHGVWFTAWAIRAPKFGNPIPPALFVLLAEGKPPIILSPNNNRSDISNKFGEHAKSCGLRIEIPVDLIPSPLRPKFKIYAYDGHVSATELSYFAPNDKLSNIEIKNGNDFIKLIQTPSTRLNDPEILTYASLHVLKKFPNDFVLGAAALCVIGYRLLNKEIIDEEIRAEFDNHSTRLISVRPDIHAGVFLRWHTSLRLILGYLAYQDEKTAESCEHFEKITSFSFQLPMWPQALTNILLATCITGFLYHDEGRVQEAIKVWSAADGILREGSTVAQFQNFYAYGELGNAVRIAQECYVFRTVAASGHPLADPSLGPIGRKIDLTNVPGPIGKLQREKLLTRESYTK